MMNSKPTAPASAAKSRISIYQMTVTALMCALMCILGPLSIPIGPVPISFTNFVIYLTLYLLGTKFGTASYCIYLLLGTAGLPVFSGYSGGLAKLAGPTGGYLAGFILTSLIAGILMKKAHNKPFLSIIGMTAGTSAAYLIGTAWFVYQASCNIWHALNICVFPFLIGDAAKILLASQIGPRIANALDKAHLRENL